jgi:aspartyl-tRNA(Asn)/glutamyl-tRNA(Gln) amidotransferase subunit A
VSDTADLGTRELLDAFRSRELSPVEAVEACAARIAAVDGELRAFTALCLDRARTEARAAQEAYDAGETVGPLAGVPFAAKDIFDTAGLVTACGSPILHDRVPERDSEAVARLRAAGAILVGKTATHEFAWGITSVNPRVQTPRNPADPRRVAGGSSGGSAVALASRQVPFALGTDTGGSARIPPSFCGTAGFKPTFGAISRDGVWPLAGSLDHPGAMAPSAGDLAPWLDALGVDLGLARRPASPRIGVCPDLHTVPLAAGVADALDAVAVAAADLYGGVSEVPFPGAARVHPTFTTIQGAEAVITHRRTGLFPARAAEYGDDVRARLESASAITLEQYADASEARVTLDRTCAALFDDVDLVVSPITAVAPPLIDDPDHVEHLGRRMALRDCVLPYTVTQDLFGLPACAIPAGRDGAGLPVGIQVWGPRGSDGLVLQAAAALESALRLS